MIWSFTEIKTFIDIYCPCSRGYINYIDTIGDNNSTINEADWYDFRPEGWRLARRCVIFDGNHYLFRRQQHRRCAVEEGVDPGADAGFGPSFNLNWERNHNKKFWSVRIGLPTRRRSMSRNLYIFPENDKRNQRRGGTVANSDGSCCITTSLTHRISRRWQVEGGSEVSQLACRLFRRQVGCVL